MEYPVIALRQTFPFPVISGSCVKIGLNYQVMDREEKSRSWGTGLSDEELDRLVNLCRTGDIQAMSTLYENFKAPLFSLAFRYTYNFAEAEDLIQDIFIKVFTHLHALDEDKAFIGWFYRISVNTCISYLRSHKKKFQKTISLEEVHHTLSDGSAGSEDRAENKLLEEAIQSLPARLKSVFLLHDVQGFKHREIADILGCSAGTSKSQLFKARMKMRKYLEKKRWL
jgi:RNA polymerase sigma-70 factor (ECF subfamily)